MNNIIYNYKIIVSECNRSHYYDNFTNKLNAIDCVKFALFCAKIVNPNTQESNACIKLVEKWLIDENLVTSQELNGIGTAAGIAAYAAYAASYAVSFVYYSGANYAAYAATYAVNYAVNSSIVSVVATAAKINKYLQILLRKTKQFQNNKILEQISKVDVDKLELVDWNMITDIMQEEYNIIHEFEYCDIFSRRCLIELLRREYT